MAKAFDKDRTTSYQEVKINRNNEKYHSNIAKPKTEERRIKIFDFGIEWFLFMKFSMIVAIFLF